MAMTAYGAYKYSTTHFQLDVFEWSASGRCRFSPRGLHFPVPTQRKLHWAQEPVWALQKK